MKILSFALTMPNRGSWNGAWSGEKDIYIRHRTVRDEVAEELMGDRESRNFYYRWEDGWGANVNVEVVDSKRKRKEARQSKGFAGYDWMIDEILEHGKILCLD